MAQAPHHLGKPGQTVHGERTLSRILGCIASGE